MINFFRNLQISPISFWYGFVSGVLFFWVLLIFQKYLPKILRLTRQKFMDLRESLSSDIEVRLRNDIYRFTQKQHLASSLFSLDEIAIEPKVLIPLIQSASLSDSAPTDSVSLAIPYIPDWPELAAIYNAPTMTLSEALQGGANIILAGHTGSGKSVALAWITALIARKDKTIGNLQDLLPLYIHATDIPSIFDQTDENIKNNNIVDLDPSELLTQSPTGKIKNSNQIVDILIQCISTYASALSINKLPRIINSALENQTAILLVDRVDELSPSQARKVTEYINILVNKYPKLRVVVTLSYDDFAGFPTLGFSLLGMAAWSDTDQSNFLNKWSQNWIKYIAPSDKTHLKNINPYYLKSWLGINNGLLKPVEFTLKVWASFSGDIIGTDGSSAIEAYIRRTSARDSGNQAALEQFALQLLIEMNYASDPHDSEKFISKFKSELSTSMSNKPDAEGKSTEPIELKVHHNKTIHGIDILINEGLLISYPGERCGFSHPIIFGYLAGKALSEFGVLNQLLQQPSWIGKNLALFYLARYGDVTSIIQNYLQEDDDLHTNHLLVSRWLQVAPKNRNWRTIILRTLTSILQKERETSNLAAKILSAMAFSGDAGVSLYFRQLLKSDHSNIKQLAALGCGILADKNAIDELDQILQEQSPASIRSASLALAAIGDKRSLEILASNLLNGSDLVRRYAAEALSNNPIEGFPALREASSMEDLLVRRSVVFGLIRIDQPWARKIVENLQLEDKEWVVRNAAIQAFDELNKKKNYAPSPLPDLIETQWLIDYAIRNGTAIAPGKPAEELVSKAFTIGTNDEKLYALDFFRNKCDRKTMDLIYSTYKNSRGDLREAIYYILWLMVLSGIRLPYPDEILQS